MHTRQRRPHLGASLALTALLLLLTTSQAVALDGYEDRRGLFGGIGIGGGVGLVNSPEGETGIDSGRKVGMHLHGIIGGGARKDLVFGAEGNWWLRTVQLGDNALEHHHLSFNGVVNYFILDAFYLDGGVGMAYTIYDAQRDNQQVLRYQELGLSAKAGAGFEFFVNSNTAIGMRFGYTRHFYTNASFDTISGGFSIRWY